MKKFVFLILSLLNAGLCAVYLALCPKEIIPTHYGITGEADGFSSKWTMLILPAVLVIIGIIYAIYRVVTEDNADAKANRKYTVKVVSGIFIFFLVLIWIFLVMTTQNMLNINGFFPAFMCFAFGGLMIFISNLLSKIKQNSYLGIRTISTLSSEKIWKKTHRLGAYLGVFGGIAMIICGVLSIFFSEIAYVLFFAGLGVFIVTALFIPTAYARVLYGREKKQNISEI